MAVRKCELCDRTESTHHITTAGLCTACDVAIHYWRKKSPSQMMARSRQIDSFANRMSVLLGNVKSLPRAGATRKKRKRVA